MTTINEITKSKVILYKGALKNNLFHQILEEVDFHVEPVIVYGKTHYPSRQISLQGDGVDTYYYSGINHSICDFSHTVKKIKQIVKYITGYDTNACLLNYYPDGKSSIGWHSDDERDINQNSPIISVSLGDSRDFYIREKFGDKNTIKLRLNNGDILVMGSGTQKNYLHSVPKRAKAGPRISLTFRNIIIN